MAYDPDEPRDEKGRWSAEGATGGADARVQDVGGDQWNRDTAARLENEYEGVRGKLDKLARDGAENGEEVTASTPQSWDDLSGGQQEQAESNYIENNLSGETDHEIENWHDNGDSYVEAGRLIAEDGDWIHEQLKEFIEQREEEGGKRIPFKPEDLADAIKITPPEEPPYKDSMKQPDIEFDDSKLQTPDNAFDPKQGTLPGIESPKPEDFLTKEMRDEIESYLSDKFVEAADEKKDSLDPPDYLGESAKESLEQQWGEMSDDDKYESAKKSGVVDESDSSNEESTTVDIPNKFDPLNETSGQNYRTTQALARYMQTERSAQLLEERGIMTKPAQTYEAKEIKVGEHAGKWGLGLPGSAATTYNGTFNNEKDAKAHADTVNGGNTVEKEDIASVNHELWDGWKDSSTGKDGVLLQVAAHEELGSRFNPHKGDSMSPDKIKEWANDNYKNVGGYEGIKALVRGTWETSQYLLDKANMPMLDLYRGLAVQGLKVAKTDDGNGQMTKDYTKYEYGDKTLNTEPVVNGLTRLPGLHIARNGASSWTTDLDVANGWRKGSDPEVHGTKVTMRAQVPRTAVISVPAYGINIHSEHEVVVLGTAWKGWDSFVNNAPHIKSVPLAHVAKATPINKPTKAEKAHTI